MIQKRYSTDAIILARRNYGESDRILTVLSSHHGKLRLLAKGVRRPQSRKRGHLEVFSYIKFSAAQGRGLDLITEVATIKSYSEVRKNLKKVSLAYYFMEVISRVAHEAEANVKLYDLVLDYLGRLKSVKNLRDMRLAFILELLTTLGFWPVGKVLTDPDRKLAEVIEKDISSMRVGKKLFV